MTHETQTQNTASLDVNVIEIGGSLYISLPKSIKKHINVTEEDKVEMMTEYTDQHGSYISFWNPDQQENHNDEYNVKE